MPETKGVQKSGLTRNFKRCPIDMQGRSPGAMVPITPSIHHGIRYIDRVTFEDGEMCIFWMGRFDKSNAIVFRSVYRPDDLWEADRVILREMWRCGVSDRTEF